MKLREKITERTGECYTQEGSACSHPIFQPQKFLNIVFEELKEYIEGLGVISDEEIMKASRVEMFLPSGELDMEKGFLTGRKQVAQAELRHILRGIGE